MTSRWIVMEELSIGAAFFAGVVSFLSPCFLPLIPAFLSYLGGVSFGKERLAAGERTKIFLNTLAFVAGFVLVFSVLGVLLNSLVMSLGYSAVDILNKISGALLVLFGLMVLGVIRIDFLEKEHGLRPSRTRYTYLTSFIFGATFAVSWSPCVGALLGAIFALALTQPGSSFTLLFAYSLGLALPFLIAGAFTAQANEFIRRNRYLLAYFNGMMGAVLLIMGLLVFTGKFTEVANTAFR